MSLAKNGFLVSVVVTCCAGVEVRAATAEAGTGGVVIESSRISADERAVLLRDLAAARTERPDAFRGLAELRAALPELDATRRGRLAPLTPALKAVGRMSIYPLLEELAFTAEPRGALTDTAWLAWRVGLIEAMGSLRDPRAAPVLFAILETPATDFLVMQAAAEAVAKLETDAAADRLIRLSRGSGVRRDAAVAGMGHCRRKPVVDRLSEILEGEPAPTLAVSAVKSLGTAANSSVWEMRTMAAVPDREYIRDTAARALLAAYVRWGGEVRRAALHRILVVNHSATLEWIREARAAARSEELREALDLLAEKFDQSPLRRR